MTISPVTLPATATAKDQRLWMTAEKLEAAFLSEMLKSAGFDQTSGNFGGGAGEAQFASLLRDENARLMAHHGGIGLAQNIFESLKRRDADAG